MTEPTQEPQATTPAPHRDHESDEVPGPLDVQSTSAPPVELGLELPAVPATGQQLEAGEGQAALLSDRCSSPSASTST